MTDTLEDHKASVSKGGKTVCNLRFADDIDGLAGSETELAELISRLDQSCSNYAIEISAEKKKKIMSNSHANSTNNDIIVIGFYTLDVTAM